MPLIQLTSGITLSYFSYPDERPSPSRPTMVLLSAFFERPEIQYAPQFKDPRFAGVNFLGVDVHGHGETVGRESWGYADNANDVFEVLKVLVVGKYFVLGTSHGGLTAQEIAIRYPENVRGIVLIATTARPFGEQFNTRIRDPFLPEWASSIPPSETALRNEVTSILGVAAKPTDAPGSVFGDRAGRNQTAERTAESAVGLELLARMMDNWRTHTGERKVVQPIETMLSWRGSESRLGGVNAPVLVIHGVDDPTVAFERGEHIISLLPENNLTRLVKLDGKGAHIINLIGEVVPELNAALKTWLDECIKAGV